MEKNKKTTTIIIVVAAVFVVAGFLFMFGGNIFNDFGSSKIRKNDSTLMPEATGTTDPINEGAVITQDFVNTTDTISSIGIVFFRITYYEDVDLVIELLDGNNILATKKIDASKVEIEHRTFVEPSTTLTGMKDKNLTIKIYSANKEDTGLVVMMSDKVDSSYEYNGKSLKGSLCFSVNE